MAQEFPFLSAGPLVELVLSVQFDSIEKLRLPQLVQAWELFRERFPKVEEHPPLAPLVEPPLPTFEARLRLFQVPPLPRLWFVAPDDTELLQLQTDRFAHNWRKSSAEAEYPRYNVVRAGFARELDAFEEYLRREQLGAFRPNLCEVSYIDHVNPVGRPHNLGALGELLRFWSADFPQLGLAEPVEASCSLRFPFPHLEPGGAGSIYVNLQPAIRQADQSEVILYEVTARRTTLGTTVEAVLRVLDQCHDAGVSAFFAVTDANLLSKWKGGPA